MDKIVIDKKVTRCYNKNTENKEEEKMNLKKVGALLLVMIMAVSLFVASACSKEEPYFVFDHVEIEVDIDVPEDSEDKAYGEQIEHIKNLELLEVAEVLNLAYAERIAEDKEDKLVWYRPDGQVEYSLASGSGNKRNVKEISLSEKEVLRDLLKDCGATITDGMMAFVEIDGDTLTVDIVVYGVVSVVKR